MIVALDHLVLTVRDIETTSRFYANALGMEVREFAGGRKALHYAGGKINLHLAGQEFEPKASCPMPGSADLCFLVDEPVVELAARLEGIGITVMEGPVSRTGSRGPLFSIYLRDPDGNLIELANSVPDQPGGSLSRRR